MKDLYSENYKTLIEEAGDNTDGRFQAHGLEEQILLKCSYYLKQSTDLVQSL